MATPYPLIQGVRHSWASLEIRVAGNIILGLTELNYSPTLDPAVVIGAGSLPIGHTVGRMEYEGDFSILLEEFNALQLQLGPNWMTKPFDIIASYDESGSGLSTIVDTLGGCRITKVEAGASADSTDPIVRKCTIKYLSLLLNGVNPGPNQPTIPQ